MITRGITTKRKDELLDKFLGVDKSYLDSWFKVEEEPSTNFNSVVVEDNDSDKKVQ
jgi:hypothetical protein